MLSSVDIAACRRELSRLTSKYSYPVLLRALGDNLYSDARLVEETGCFPEEVDRKDAVAKALTNLSAWLHEEPVREARKGPERE